mmetsp:Transcript_1154/g.2494  ORF Transcript_1154/g.2494 Transcript_1154/m.2494 type:complete len:282 (-) Transcript_1154:25-870(-)
MAVITKRIGAVSPSPPHTAATSSAEVSSKPPRPPAAAWMVAGRGLGIVVLIPMAVTRHANSTFTLPATTSLRRYGSRSCRGVGVIAATAHAFRACRCRRCCCRLPHSCGGVAAAGHKGQQRSGGGGHPAPKHQDGVERFTTRTAISPHSCSATTTSVPCRRRPRQHCRAQSFRVVPHLAREETPLWRVRSCLSPRRWRGTKGVGNTVTSDTTVTRTSDGSSGGSLSFHFCLHQRVEQHLQAVFELRVLVAAALQKQLSVVHVKVLETPRSVAEKSGPHERH